MTVLLLLWRGAEASFQQSCSLNPYSAVQAKEADDLQAVLRYNLALQVRLLIILCKAGLTLSRVVLVDMTGIPFRLHEMRFNLSAVETASR